VATPAICRPPCKQVQQRVRFGADNGLKMTGTAAAAVVLHKRQQTSALPRPPCTGGTCIEAAAPLIHKRQQTSALPRPPCTGGTCIEAAAPLINQRSFSARVRSLIRASNIGPHPRSIACMAPNFSRSPGHRHTVRFEGHVRLGSLGLPAQIARRLRLGPLARLLGRWRIPGTPQHHGGR
jgi:hypothetical protein